MFVGAFAILAGAWLAMPNSAGVLAADDRKPATFELYDAGEFEDTWGFTKMTNLGTTYMEQNRYSTEVREACEIQLQGKPVELHKYSKLGTAVYYPTTERFRNFEGIDLIPQNKDNYVRGGKIGPKLTSKEKDEIMPGEDIMIRSCRVPTDDGGAWHTQRVGPFYSTGGYDWWQVGWEDVAMMTEPTAKHESVDVDVNILSAVTGDGTKLNFPPIHVHHTHVVSRNGVKMRQYTGGSRCSGGKGSIWSPYIDPGQTYLKEKNCYNSSLYFEQHGDYVCRDEDGGTDCLNVPFGDMPRRITEGLDVEGEWNDVRPAGSPRLQWFYEATIHWKPSDLSKKANSMNTIMAPGSIDFEDQLTRFITYMTWAHAEHFLWYTGHMWTSGELVRNKLHAHNSIFESAQWFAATPSDLGLDDPRFMPKQSYYPFETSTLGVEFNNGKMLEWVLQNLEQSQRDYDQFCVSGAPQAREQCSRPRPMLVCTGKSDAEYLPMVDERGEELYVFDRRPKTHCLDEWTFKEGEPFVVTSFSRKLTAPPNPAQKEIPAYVPGHTSWQFWYHAPDRDESRFNRIVCNQFDVFFDSDYLMDPFTMISMVESYFQGGIPRSHWYRPWVRAALMGVTAWAAIATLGAVGMRLRKKMD